MHTRHHTVLHMAPRGRAPDNVMIPIHRPADCRPSCRLVEASTWTRHRQAEIHPRNRRGLRVASARWGLHGAVARRALGPTLPGAPDTLSTPRFALPSTDRHSRAAEGASWERDCRCDTQTLVVCPLQSPAPGISFMRFPSRSIRDAASCRGAPRGAAPTPAVASLDGADPLVRRQPPRWADARARAPTLYPGRATGHAGPRALLNCIADARARAVAPAEATADFRHHPHIQ